MRRARLCLAALASMGAVGCAYDWSTPASSGAGQGGAHAGGAGQGGAHAGGAAQGGAHAGGGATTVDAGGAGGATPTGAPCPGDIVDAPCTAEGRTCESGADPRPWCRAHVVCKGGAWQVAADAADASCATPPAACDTMKDVPCASGDAPCVDDVGHLCSCATDGTQGAKDFAWRCDAPPAGCPATYPSLDTACGADEILCEYGACSASPPTRVRRLCQAGVWRDPGDGC